MILHENHDVQNYGIFMKFSVLKNVRLFTIYTTALRLKWFIVNKIPVKVSPVLIFLR
ncbi:hypothetical protein SAMN05421856_107198 [Chryseobacterium taichungense]|uniref:Uncharacterized protein n=1 Tax=Chryseobacterium taichungense TaxID=295069 RepID=A0A1H8BTD7_9FLAO|nr:hypothetical protein SAMN05421856_107198 [Chryseobacterium taichungense]